MATEDLTTYTETDANNRLSESASTVTITGQPRNNDTRLTKDHGAGHFSVDFEHLFDIAVSSHTDGSQLVFHALLDTEQAWDGGFDEAICGFINGWDTNGRTFQLHEADASTHYYDETATSFWSDSTTYYMKMKRVEGAPSVIYLYIYSDSARTNLLDTLSLNLHDDEDFRYLSIVQGRSNVDTKAISGTIANVDLQEAGGDGNITAQPIAGIAAVNNLIVGTPRVTLQSITGVSSLTNINVASPAPIVTQTVVGIATLPNVELGTPLVSLQAILGVAELGNMILGTPLVTLQSVLGQAILSNLEVQGGGHIIPQGVFGLSSLNNISINTPSGTRRPTRLFLRRV